MIKTAAASTATHAASGARKVGSAAHQARATPLVQRLAAAEPITTVHKKTNLDSSVLVTVATLVAQSGVLFMITIPAIYVFCWVVLTIKTHV